MARNRMLDPNFWLDEDLASLSAHARLLYMGLWGICDDNYATFPNRPAWVKAQVFPYENIDVVGLLDELSTSAHLVLFRTESGAEYWYLPNFFKHQKIDRPSKPKYPSYEERVVEPSTSPRPEVKLSKENIREIKLTEDQAEISQPSAARTSSGDDFSFSEQYKKTLGRAK